MYDGNLIPISDEQAKLGQEGLKVLQGLGSFLAKALGSVPEDLVGYLGGDWLRMRRAENMAKMMFAAEERLEARGIKDTKPASLTLALPILRCAADESREELLDLWARLLAAAMDPSRENLIRMGFVEAIQKMDPLDALVIAHVRDDKRGMLLISKRDTVLATLNVSMDELLVSLSNLMKNGMMSEMGQPPGNIITPFGREFLRVVLD